MIFRTIFAGLALTLAGTGATAVQVEKPKKLLAMTPEAFRQAVKIHDDPLEFTATLSTEPAYRNGKGLTNVVWDDAHLRAIVDKRTAEVRYEVQQILRHPHGNRSYVRVNYLTPNGLRQATPVVSNVNDDYCLGTQGGPECIVLKKISFVVDAKDVRDMVASYAPGNHGNFVFRFKDVAGHHHTNKLITAEIVGLVEAVDKYTATAGLKSVGSAEMASAGPL